MEFTCGENEMEKASKLTTSLIRIRTPASHLTIQALQ